MKVIGSYLSPYVRKVLACLHLKDLPYEIDPIVPFYGSDEFTRLSPLRRVPVLLDGDTVLSDSTVICEYLDEKYPAPRLRPETPEARARARWLEEYADSRLGDVLIWHLYNQVVIRRFVWGQEPDAAVLERALKEEIPDALDYLERQLPERGLLFGSASIADVSLASFFRNATFARYRVDAARWPRVSRYVGEVLALPAFARLAPFEELCLKTPIAQHRDALRAAGAPVSADTVGTGAPRRGVMAT